LNSELVGQLERSSERRRIAVRLLRRLAIESLGPLTMLAGIVWAIAQPYRITFLHRDGKGLYDFLVQPPLLVVLVGFMFAIAVAPGLLQDLRDAEEEAEGGA
jgi:hypothetical protein